jgi:hypothetical protein
MLIREFRDKVNTICDELLSSSGLNPIIDSTPVLIFNAEEKTFQGITAVEYIQNRNTLQWEIIIHLGETQ